MHSTDAERRGRDNYQGYLQEIKWILTEHAKDRERFLMTEMQIREAQERILARYWAKKKGVDSSTKPR